LDKEEFVQKAKLVHGDKYVYSLVDYKKGNIKVKIICREHGVFEQTPYRHLNKHGCKECNPKRALTTKEFIIKAKEIHGDKYNYSLVKYVNWNTPVKIICCEHGVFEILAGRLLDRKTKNSCPECKKIDNLNIVRNPTNKKTTEEFIEDARKIHGTRYEYALVKYERGDIPVIIGCPIHGKFEQKPNNHLKGYGCPFCGNYRKMMKMKKFISRLDF
jgi:rubrerythrin